MKASLTILFCFAILCFTQAQDFEIIGDVEKAYHGTIGTEIHVPIKVKNISNKPINIYIERVATKIGSTQTTQFCWGKDCFDKEVNSTLYSKRLEPGEVSEEFVSILNTGLVNGFSTINYEVFTRTNQRQRQEVELTYVVEDETTVPLLFNSEDIVLNEVYPNPVKEFAVVDYQINNPDIQAKIVLHNVLGSVVGEFELPVLEKELKISAKEFKPGVYFYTLYIDGDGIATKKLVIRR